MKFQAEKYNTRTDLENDVRNKIGLTSEVKDKHTVEGTREDLARLKLSDRSIFWGMKCIITDSPTKIEPKSEADRGKKFKSGINGRPE